MELTPQGTLAERLRAGGAGIPAFYTPTGYGTLIHEGGAPIKYQAGGGELEIASEPREARTFEGRGYVMERASERAESCLERAVVPSCNDANLLMCSYGGLCAHQGVEGRLPRERGVPGDCSEFQVSWQPAVCPSAHTHNQLRAPFCSPDVAKAAAVCIAEVEEIVPDGALRPEDVHLPGIYVSRLIKVCLDSERDVMRASGQVALARSQGLTFEKRIERLTLARPGGVAAPPADAADKVRELIARRAAQELQGEDTACV